MVRPALLESGWTEDDGLIRWYTYHHEATLARYMQVWEYNHEPMNLYAGLCFPLGLLCLPCLCCDLASYSTKRTMTYENTIENTFSRRVGITKDGIVFKQLRTEPVTYDPMNMCAVCCCATGRFPEEATQSSTKVIPIDRVQDIKVEEPAGGTRQIVSCCGCIPREVGDLIPDVDAYVHISTAGDVGAELVVYGLTAASHLRDTVIAIKAGRPMPPPVDGVQDTGYAGDMPVTGNTEEPSLGGFLPAVLPAMGSAEGTPQAQRSCFAEGMVPPGMKDEESVALLRSIDSKLGQLISVTQAKA